MLLFIILDSSASCGEYIFQVPLREKQYDKSCQGSFRYLFQIKIVLEYSERNNSNSVGALILEFLIVNNVFVDNMAVLLRFGT